jgi:hypothetical protein
VTNDARPPPLGVDAGSRAAIEIPGVRIAFLARPATPVTLRVRDADGRATMASFVFRDRLGRVYPAKEKRLAPDIYFQPQVYREDGEVFRLAAGDYAVEFTRGPEYRALTKPLLVGAHPQEAAFDLERWIDPARHGWISGDHHIHASGCRHYDDPTPGTDPEDIWRQIRGEDLRVGAILTWGPHVCSSSTSVSRLGDRDADFVHAAVSRGRTAAVVGAREQRG